MKDAGEKMSIVERAKVELDIIGFGDEDSRVMVDLLERFFNQWDSGAAVSVVAPILHRLIAGKPLSPLMGEDGEWMDTSEHNDPEMVGQNKRCSTVFKRADGTAYDIAPGQRTPITFPYWPVEAVSPPVF